MQQQMCKIRFRKHNYAVFSPLIIYLSNDSLSLSNHIVCLFVFYIFLNKNGERVTYLIYALSQHTNCHSRENQFLLTFASLFASNLLLCSLIA